MFGLFASKFTFFVGFATLKSQLIALYSPIFFTGSEL